MIRTSRKLAANRLVRLFGARGAATLLLGTALSVGGLAEAFDGAHFLVEKNLDSVRVMRDDRAGARVVANFGGGFAGNSVFKLSRVLPESVVTQRLSLFDEGWLPRQGDRGVFHEEMKRINSVIRRDFFANAMPYGDLIHQKSEKYGVDPLLVAAVIEQESRFRRTARSTVGAQGLMQLMPRTGRWMGAQNLYDAEQNVDAGVKYMRYLEKRFGGGNTRKILAAYNAGEGNVRRYNGIPPFRETQTYVKKVMGNYERRNEELQRFNEEQHGSDEPADDGATAVAMR